MNEHPLLPKFKAPKNLEDAITQAALMGRSHHEHCYLLGKLMGWIREQVGIKNRGAHQRPENIRGKGFTNFVKRNFWFTDHYAYCCIKYASQCDEAGYLLPQWQPTDSAKRSLHKRIEGNAKPEDVELRGSVGTIIADYFPEAWISAGSDHRELFNGVEARRSAALKKLLADLPRSHIALIYMGFYLLLESKKAAA